MAAEDGTLSLGRALALAGAESYRNGKSRIVRIPPNANGGGLMTRTAAGQHSVIEQMILDLYGWPEGDEYL